MAVSLQKVDQFKNRDACIHTAVITQNQLLEYARKAAPQRDFKVINLDSAELEKQAWEKYNSGDNHSLGIHAKRPATLTSQRSVALSNGQHAPLLHH